jgi:hypothetical protein
MVPLEQPDLRRYPRFQHALAAAQSAELEPGDAVYIPYFWWHHVQSLDRFNTLVNYWWDDASVQFGSPYDCLLHSFLTLRQLPPGSAPPGGPYSTTMCFNPVTIRWRICRRRTAARWGR